MHIILGLLGVIVTILVLMNRLQENGFDIGWLNPFSWQRRRKYRKQHDLNPAFKLDSPMEVAALYMVMAAKVDGDISQQQKAKILELFQSEFHLSSNKARELLRSSVHLFDQSSEVLSQPEKIISRSYNKITADQSRSICLLVDEIAKVEDSQSDLQKQLIAKIKRSCPSVNSQKW